jgi:hypothetical protein
MSIPNPPKDCHLNAGFTLNYDGLTIEYFPASLDVPVIVSLAIGCEPINCYPLLSIHLTPEAFQKCLAQQFQSLLLPMNSQTIVDDPALLHLIQLLQIEIQQPQVLNQILVWSIVTALIIQLIRGTQLGLMDDCANS